MEFNLSPKQVAKALGASESSVKRWCDDGLLATVKTGGGHRRIAVQEAVRFARERSQMLAEPQILAMPPTENRVAGRIEGCAERFLDALLTNRASVCSAIMLNLFQAGNSVSRIFDEVVAVAFRTIGERWECHELEVYQERSSCQIALRAIHELKEKLVTPRLGPIAIGATAEGDQYELPVAMAEVVLRSIGWDTQLLGSSIPFDSMSVAIRRIQPKLFWLSVSHIIDQSKFILGFNRLVDVASNSNTAIVVGGRALTPEIRTQLRYSAFCDGMCHLEEFAKAIQFSSTSNNKTSKPTKRK